MVDNSVSGPNGWFDWPSEADGGGDDRKGHEHKKRATMKTALFGLAKSEGQAASIVDQLKVAGFFGDDISVLSSEGTTTTRQFAHEQHSKAPEGATIGGGIGVIVGAMFGW